MFKYLLLFGGIVSMITGCNSLVSQQFGTHRLRTLPVAEAAGGVGDADFVQLSDGQLMPAQTTRPGETTGVTYRFRAIGEAGGSSKPVLVGWWKCKQLPCPVPVDTTRSGALRGLVGPPDDRFLPSAEWLTAVAGSSGSAVLYLQLGQTPLAWYWNLLLFVGGLCIAVGSQYRDFRKERS